jgi:hypothetical protein
MASIDGLGVGPDEAVQVAWEVAHDTSEEGRERHELCAA